MRELPTEVLVEYVDEQTPEEAPPFEYVERAVRARRRRRNVLATAAAVIAVAGAVVATVDLPRAEQEPAEVITTPTPGYLDDGPPPAQFKVGTTLLVLQAETAVSSVRLDPHRPSMLIVEVPRDPYVAAACVPTTVVRILGQDASTVRIAAYRYAVGPEQNEGRQCVQPDETPTAVHLDLRQALDGRKVYAGSTGYRTLLN
ncbi:hypothetical protein EV652_109194 [Kribbella steppae]|uniref:Uncharacterized protein n=1 Tax=Kribbella steppae TaxID=2512223 RepID=A0A4R2H8X6_9ACTN|nr:hypothetical protein [Kribbella steppae]TCO23368.1 hypothetical protein EV652_109194 [Kribbella steppae]